MATGLDTMNCNCVVLECSSSLEHKINRISFHHFPKNPELRNAWTKNVQQLNNQNLSVESFSIICSEHFKKDCFDNCSLKGKFLIYGSLPTIFPRCSMSNNIISQFTPTKINVPDRTLESKQITKVVVPKIPDMKGTADIRFKELLVKSIEKTKKLDQNIIFLDQLLEKPNDANDDEVNQAWLKKAVSDVFKNVDYDLLILAIGADNVIDGRTITKISQISPKMVQNSDNFDKIKILMQHHLQMLCEREDELKTIQEYQKKLSMKTKEEDFVFDKLQIRKKYKNVHNLN